MTPDPVPVPKDRPPVLIGPSDNPPAQSHDGSQQDRGDSADGDASTPHQADSQSADD